MCATKETTQTPLPTLLVADVGAVDLDAPTRETEVAGVSTLLCHEGAVVASIHSKKARGLATVVLREIIQYAKSTTKLATPQIGVGIGTTKIMFLILGMQQPPPTLTRWTQTGAPTRELPITSREN
jgi:hypothetical protein